MPGHRTTWEAPALALARLAQVDPGGRWANRPDRSLAQIFLTWPPQTSATQDERLAVVDMLRRDTPDVAWTLMNGLLPTPHSVGFFPTRRAGATGSPAMSLVR